MKWKKDDEANEKKALEEEKKNTVPVKENPGNGGAWALKMPKNIVDGGSGKFSSEAR